ncbi:MAG TPA: hypothetical protein DIW77_21795 [Chromatiaceae bacterium]|jgi:transposase|nr:hypothetical protein [Chromatiaceae bacterium]
MHFSDHDLRQLDEAALARLTPERAPALLCKALEDLKAAREKLAENSTNSSTAEPPGAVGADRGAWEGGGVGQGAGGVCAARGGGETGGEVGVGVRGEDVRERIRGEAGGEGGGPPGPAPRRPGAQPQSTASGGC